MTSPSAEVARNEPTKPEYISDIQINCSAHLTAFRLRRAPVSFASSSRFAGNFFRTLSRSRFLSPYNTRGPKSISIIAVFIEAPMGLEEPGPQHSNSHQLSSSRIILSY